MADGTAALAIPPGAFPVVRTGQGSGFPYTPATGRIFVLLGAYIHTDSNGGAGTATVQAGVVGDTALTRDILTVAVSATAGQRGIAQLRCCVPNNGIVLLTAGTAPTCLFSIFGYDCDARSVGRGFYSPRIPEGAVSVVRATTTVSPIYTVRAGRVLVILHTWSNLVATAGVASGAEIQVQVRDEFFPLHWSLPAADFSTPLASAAFLMPLPSVMEVGDPLLDIDINTAFTDTTGILGFSGYEFSRKR